MKKQLTVYLEKDVEKILCKLARKIINQSDDVSSLYGLKTQIVNNALRLLYKREFENEKEKAETKVDNK